MNETFKFKLFYFIRFFGDALFTPFLSIYFVSKGITETNLGILLAITPFMTILVNPFWNWLVKDAKTSRLILKIMTLIEGALIILLTRVSGFELYALIVTLIAFFCSPFIPIQDGFTAVYTNQTKIEYTSIRIYASIAYVFALAVAGLAALFMDYDGIFLIAGAFYVLTALVAQWIKPLDEGKPTEVRPKRDLKSLFRNSNFIKYLIFYTVMIGSVRIGDSFYGVYMTSELGLSNSEFGLVFSAFIIAEVIVMRYLVLHGSHFSDKALYVTAAIMFAARFLAYALQMPNSVIIVMTMFRGIAWGIVLYAHIKYIIRIVRVENVFVAIMMISLTFSIYTGVGNFFFGAYIEKNGYASFYLIHMVMIVLSLAFYLVLPPKLKTEPSSLEMIGDQSC
jgi:MFS transporter, PPP family, 3-phenylpropionic acid transporter